MIDLTSGDQTGGMVDVGSNMTKESSDEDFLPAVAQRMRKGTRKKGKTKKQKGGKKVTKEKKRRVVKGKHDFLKTKETSGAQDTSPSLL